MVESSGLLNRRSVKNATGGSNPPLSASYRFQTVVSGIHFIFVSVQRDGASITAFLELPQ